MDIQGTDPADDLRADEGDLIEQAEPPVSEPVDEALASEERITAADPELTGEEAEAAEDSGQA
jgi:hypothetical protein